MPITADLVELSAVPMHPHIEKMMELRKRFMPYDGQRISYAFNRAKGGETCLEIGPGRGDLTRMLSRARLYKSIDAIDIIDRTKHIPQAVNFQIMSVGEMDFPDRSFDSVFCMEVLEHLDDETFKEALSEVRRVCRGQLVITVPFLEPMPSKYHLQRFTEERVRNLFPDARLSLLLKEPVMRVPWLMIEEERL